MLYKLQFNSPFVRDSQVLIIPAKSKNQAISKLCLSLNNKYIARKSIKVIKRINSK